MAKRKKKRGRCQIVTIRRKRRRICRDAKGRIKSSAAVGKGRKRKGTKSSKRKGRCLKWSKGRTRCLKRAA